MAKNLSIFHCRTSVFWRHLIQKDQIKIVYTGITEVVRTSGWYSVLLGSGYQKLHPSRQLSAISKFVFI